MKPSGARFGGRSAAIRLGSVAAVLALCTAPAPSIGAQTAVVYNSVQPRRLLIISVSRLPTREPVLYLADERGHQERIVERLGTSRGPVSWSPDSSRFAWLDRRGLEVEETVSGKRHLLLKSPCPYSSCYGMPSSFVWSPDGKALLVGGVGQFGDRLRVVSVTTGSAKDVTPQPRRRSCNAVSEQSCVQYSVIGWSRGGLIAYRAATSLNQSPVCAIWVAKPNGTHPRKLRRIADGCVHDDPAAELSPDGDFIALITDHRDPADPRFGVIATRTGKLRVIPDLAPQELAWSPVSRLAVSGTRVAGINPEPIVLNPDGTHRHMLALPARGLSPYFLSWSSGGDLVFLAGQVGFSGRTTGLAAGGYRDVFLSSGGRSRPRLLFQMQPHRPLLAVIPN